MGDAVNCKTHEEYEKLTGINYDNDLICVDRHGFEMVMSIVKYFTSETEYEMLGVSITPVGGKDALIRLRLANFSPIDENPFKIMQRKIKSISMRSAGGDIIVELIVEGVWYTTPILPEID